MTMNSQTHAEHQTRVEQPTGLYPALLAFQADPPELHKDKNNPAFKGVKYLSLDSLMAAVLPKLNECGLVWTTLPTFNNVNGEAALEYKITHAATGEHLSSVMPLMLSKQDAQGQGSAITYARRYALMAVLGLVADEDDDGNAAQRKQQQAPRPVQTMPPPVQNGGLPDHIHAEVVATIKSASLAPEQIRLRLISAGVEDVPELVTPATLRALSIEQASSLLDTFNKAAL